MYSERMFLNGLTTSLSTAYIITSFKTNRLTSTGVMAPCDEISAAV